MSQFVDVPGLEWLFAVSPEGRVLRKGRTTNGGQLSACELKVRVLNAGKGKTIRGVRVAIEGKKKEFSLRALLRRTFGEPTKPEKVRTEVGTHEDRILPEGRSAVHERFPRYLVWENGAVTGVHGKPILQKRSGRYRSTVLRDAARKSREIKTHRLVLEAFVGPRPHGMVACHGWNGPLDNSLGNLRWGTPESNDKDRICFGKLLRFGLL